MFLSVPHGKVLAVRHAEKRTERSQDTGVTWEYPDGENCRDVHIRALFDDKGRMMVIACHNTDNGDGWEREQEFHYFFRQFSEKRDYPLGINIVFYAMTH